MSISEYDIKKPKRDYSHLKRAVIQRHRKDKNLCLRCGTDIHNGQCIEIYNKADNREKETKKVIVDIDRRNRTITSYRKKKNLCLRCGQEKHEGSCEEEYSKSDNRIETEKQKRPAIIKTPKKQSKSILQTIKEQKTIPCKLSELKQTNKPVFQRSFILVDLHHSKKNNKFLYSSLEFIIQRYKSHITAVVGRMSKLFVYSDYLKLKKSPNLYQIQYEDTQTTINHICDCELFISYPNELTDYCLYHKIPVCILPDDKDIDNLIIAKFKK